MRTRIFKMTALVAVATAMLADITSCKEDVQCEIPTVPTTTTLEDGAIIRDPNACFPNDDYFVSGSTIASDGSIYYNYYVGTSLENMEKYSDSDKCRLIPYTKYYWYAIARIGYPEDGESEPTPVRTFYYVPSFSANLETDNGENEMAIVGHWKPETSDGKFYVTYLGSYKFTYGGFSNFRVAIEPEEDGINCDKTVVPISQEDLDSCRFSILAGDDYATHSQDWDDKNGVYYEPIKYKIRLVADVQIGDTVIDAYSSAVNEIFLDKSKMVRDPQFNVYRVAKIGYYIWMLDNLRYIPENSERYKIAVLKSGEKGVLYKFQEILSQTHSQTHLPKGFELASDIAWNDLLIAYGVDGEINWQTVGYENYPYPLNSVKNGLIDRFAQNYESKHNDPQLLEYYNEMNYDTTFYKYQSLDMFGKLRSQYGWYNPEDGSEMDGEPTLFNAKPFGMINGEDNYSINSAAFFCSVWSTDWLDIIGIWANNKGICLVDADCFYRNPNRNHPYSENWYFPIRCVKLIE